MNDSIGLLFLFVNSALLAFVGDIRLRSVGEAVKQSGGRGVVTKTESSRLKMDMMRIQYFSTYISVCRSCVGALGALALVVAYVSSSLLHRLGDSCLFCLSPSLPLRLHRLLSVVSISLFQ